MSRELEKYLLEAEGKTKEQLSSENPYRDIGFDGQKPRLGWMRVISFSKIKERLHELDHALRDKENFLFIGMGGSINGIKALLSLRQKSSCYTLDSLDPRALKEILTKIGDLKKTLIVPISKSGTTKETQLLSTTLKELFAGDWLNHFVWLTDPTSFDKIDSLGWKGSLKISLQLDGETDIGGRFSCPHTLIFFLPLFLLLKKDFQALKAIYETYISFQGKIRESAYQFAERYKDYDTAYFCPESALEDKEAFSSWIVQLFQESLGSKRQNFSIKTLGCFEEKKNGFLPLQLDFTIDNPIISLMAQMYFFQVFIAYYAALKRVDFVTQDFVEKYKEQMRKLGGESLDDIASIDEDSLTEEVRRRIKDSHHFIEIVLYFYPTRGFIRRIERIFKAAFCDKIIFVFIGSDWNHHSYQAAFADKSTFYIFLLSSYTPEGLPFPGEILQKNVRTLHLISKATYLTLQEKSLLFRLQNTD
ncbi:MAG: hypothetical protein JSW40_03935 [Candidatus Omnitrophota bacterium]|nr:MAG: hypothetical protein JSW40_03935 [Candidatus Omnitrophota bacterium]